MIPLPWPLSTSGDATCNCHSPVLLGAQSVQGQVEAHEAQRPRIDVAEGHRGRATLQRSDALNAAAATCQETEGNIGGKMNQEAFLRSQHI